MTLRDIINLGHVTNITTETIDIGWGMGTSTIMKGTLTHNYYRKEAIGGSSIYQMLPKGTEVNIGSKTNLGASATGFYPPQK